jgi:DNA-binding transcriptional LysR family regulator
MRSAHNVAFLNLDLLRSFFVVAEHGSLNKAAERLRLSQSTLTRQMHALEHELGGRLLERSSTGVALTAAGNAIMEQVRPAVVALDAALGEARRTARGQSAQLRIGYLQSATADYLNPALAALRRKQSQVKLKLLDLSPGEQISALRKGEIDLAIVGSAGSFLSREFYVRRIATLPVFAVLAEAHARAVQATVRLTELRGELFVGAKEEDVPGYNRWIEQICRRAGYRTQFVGNAESLSHSFSMVVSENAVALIPSYSTKSHAPGVVFRPIADAKVKWDLMVAWQRGAISPGTKIILEALAPMR